jgi:hypothetical protein
VSRRARTLRRNRALAREVRRRQRIHAVPTRPPNRPPALSTPPLTATGLLSSTAAAAKVCAYCDEVFTKPETLAEHNWRNRRFCCHEHSVLHRAAEGFTQAKNHPWQKRTPRPRIHHVTGHGALTATAAVLTERRCGWCKAPLTRREGEGASYKSRRYCSRDETDCAVLAAAAGRAVVRGSRPRVHGWNGTRLRPPGWANLTGAGQLRGTRITFTPQLELPAPKATRRWEWALVIARAPAFANPRFLYFDTEQDCRAAERQIDPEFVTTVVCGAKAALRCTEGQRLAALREALIAINGKGRAYGTRNRLAAPEDDDDEPVDLDDLEYPTNGHQVDLLTL